MNVESTEIALHTFKRGRKNDKLVQALTIFLWWLLTPQLWPKRSRQEGTKKKLRKIRQIIRLLEAYPDKPEWKLFATFGPIPKDRDGNCKPHSMIDALKIAMNEEEMLLEEQKLRRFSGPICGFNASGNIELTRRLYVADLIGAAVFRDKSQFAFWKDEVPDKKLPLSVRAIIKRIREFRETGPHCQGIVELKLFEFKCHSVFTTDRKSFVAWAKHADERAGRRIRRQLCWASIDRRILHLLLRADQCRTKQSRARKEAKERRWGGSSLRMDAESHNNRRS